MQSRTTLGSILTHCWHIHKMAKGSSFLTHGIEGVGGRQRRSGEHARARPSPAVASLEVTQQLLVLEPEHGKAHFGIPLRSRLPDLAGLPEDSREKVYVEMAKANFVRGSAIQPQERVEREFEAFQMGRRRHSTFCAERERLLEALAGARVDSMTSNVPRKYLPGFEECSAFAAADFSEDLEVASSCTAGHPMVEEAEEGEEERAVLRR